MKLDHLLPKILAVITRHPREKVEIKWSKQSYTHNVFRVYEMIFWKRKGIKAQQTSGVIIDEQGNRREFFVCHSWENVIATAEGLFREYLKSVWKKLKQIRTPDFNFFDTFSPQFSYSGIDIKALQKGNNYLDSYKFAIAVDSNGTPAKNASQNILNYNHTCTGSNLSMITSGGERVVATTATYNSVSMTVGTSATNGAANVRQFWLASPATGTNTVSVSFASSGNVVSMTTSFTGTAGTFSGNTTATGTSTTPTVNITSATGDLVVDAATGGGALTVGAGQTQLNNTINANGNGTSSEPGAATVTMSWTQASSVWAISGVSMQASGGGPVVNSNFLMFM